MILSDSFLDNGKKYVAIHYPDVADAHWQTNLGSYAIRELVWMRPSA